jgi:ABC-type nitrate/sulfonate/bicarbonate transport system substrate-binding protein
MAGTGALGLGLMGLGAGPVRAQDMESVVHQLGWVKSIQFGGHFAAIHNGYFEEEGIEAEFLAGGPNSIGTDVAIATGQADTSDTDVPGTIRSRARAHADQGLRRDHAARARRDHEPCRDAR